MGYRSEVDILINLPKHVSAQKMVDKFKKAWGEDFDIVDTTSVKNCVFLSIDWVKWYEGTYKEVDNIMKLVNRWESHYKTGGIHFVRIGESIEDTEEIISGDCERILNVERIVTLPNY